MAKLYSYIRWSSNRQEAGTSLARQTAAARKFAVENDLEYVEILDAGISAFRGKNATHGALADFIAAVKAGAIPAGSWLFLENLDRLSREHAMEATDRLRQLLKLGITIFTAQDKKVHRPGDERDTMSMIFSIIAFERAHQESSYKSERVKANAVELIRRHRAGERVNIKSVGNVPWWIDASGKTVERHVTLFPAARRACELLLEGWGIFRVVNYLNSHIDIYPPPQRNKRADKTRPPAAWNAALIRKLQQKYVTNNDTQIKDKKGQVKKVLPVPNETIKGDWVIHIDGREEELKSYFPSLVTETEYARLHDLRLSNKFKAGDELKVITLLSGLRLLKCGHCGGGMSFHSRSTKGGTRERDTRYQCVTSRTEPTKCTNWSVKGLAVEATTIRALMYGYVHDAVLNGVPVEDLTPQIEAGRERLDSIKSQIDNFTAAIGLGGNLETLVSSIKRLEEEKANTLLELDRLQQQQALAGSEGDTHKRLVEVMRLLTPALLNDPTHPDRVAVRELCRKVFQRVVITRHLDKSITIAYTYPDNSQLISEGVWLPAARKGGKPIRGFTVYTLSPDGQRHDDIYSQISQAVSAAPLDDLPVSLPAPAVEAVERLALRLGHQPMQGRDFFTLRNQ